MEQPIFKKAGMGFVPVNEPAREFFHKTKDGQLVTLEGKRGRNLGHIRKAFALRDLVFRCQEKFDTPEKLRQGLTYMAGYVDSVVVATNGDVVMTPKSWSFKGMDQEEFDALYSDFKTEALKILPTGWTNEQIDNAVLEIISF